MRRVGLLLILGSGCFTDPDTFYAFRGSVHAARPEGSQGAVVTLSVERQSQHWGECSGDAARTALTDADGGYAFEALAGELFDPALGARSACLRFETRFDGGATAFADLSFVDSTKTVLPTLDEWVPSASADGGVVTFHPFGSSARDPVMRPTAGHRVELEVNGALGWAAADTGDFDGGVLDEGTFLFDADELEDFAFAVKLEAFRWEEVPNWAASVPPNPTTTRSTRARIKTGLELRGVEVPASRGAACPAVGSPCPLTDGRLEPMLFTTPLTRLTFELSRPVAPRHVIIRGMMMRGIGTETVSVNGAQPIEPRRPPDHWPFGTTTIGGVHGEPTFAAYDLPPMAAVSSVTLELAVPVQALAEVSLFE